MKKCLLVVAAVSGLPYAAMGEESMDNIISRASRTPQPASQLGSVVSTIDREQIEQRKPAFISDLLQDVPGVTVSRSGGYGAQTQIRMRGSEANHVMVVIDGVEANDPASSDEFTFEQLTSWDIQNIEVIRGPQSALWGSDALAGVINITTRRSEESRQIGAFGEAGSFDTRYFGGHFGANGERTSFDFSASSFDTDGTNISREGNEDDGYENISTSAQVSFQATDNLNFSAFGRYSEATNEFDPIDFATSLPTDGDLETDVELGLLRLSTDFGSEESPVDHSLQFTVSDSNRQNKDSGADTSATKGRVYGYYYQQSYNLSGSDLTNNLVLAVDHEKQDFEQDGQASPFGDPNKNEEYDTTGFAAEYLLQPIDPLNLSVSIRRDNHSDFKDKTSYRLAGTWRFNRTGTRLHTSWGTGQKNPTFTDRFGFSDQFIGNPNLKPEESEAFDVGVEQRFLDDRARIDVTYFRANLDDEINGFVFDPVAGLFTAENEDGTSRRQGVEVEGDIRITDGLRARASYTYTNAKEPDDINGGRSREIRRPRHMASLGMNYRFLNDKADLNLNLSHTGKQKDAFFNPNPPFDEQRRRLKKYTLVDVAASYDVTETFEVYARAENLFSKDYENVFGYNTPGAAYFAGLRMRLRQ